MDNTLKSVLNLDLLMKLGVYEHLWFENLQPTVLYYGVNSMQMDDN